MHFISASHVTILIDMFAGIFAVTVEIQNLGIKNANCLQ